MLKTDHILAAKNLAALARKSSELYADRTAMSIVLANGMSGHMSFQKLDELSDQFAVYLREVLRLPAGSSVAVQMPNCLPYPIAVFGILKAGLVLVNVNPLYTVPEMIHQLNDSEAEALITVDLFQDKAAVMLDKTKVKHLVITRLPEFMPFLSATIAQTVLKYARKQIPNVDLTHTPFVEALKLGQSRQSEKGLKTESYFSSLSRESIAVLQYTGGTTGVSKGAVLTHGNIIANMSQLFPLLSERLESGRETVMTALPLYHIFAFTLNFLSFHALGAHNILIPSPRPISNLRKAFEKFPISVLSGVNTLYNALNHETWFQQNPPKSLRIAVAGGMALHSQVAASFQKLTGIPVIEGYGLTETSPVVSFNPFEKPKDGSIGLPLPDTQVKLIASSGQTAKAGEPGELAVKGPQVMKGYWKRPEETRMVMQDGWFLTGDIATQDEEGYLTIVDRKKDMILVSGFNVYPNEVEEALSQHPQILEAAVIGVPDGAAGEAVKAILVAKGETQPSAEELRAHCKSLLTAYKVPKFFEFRKELPKTPVGKILRKELRADQAAQRH
ncbi:MAG: AMP-binding protein [Bdellovibrionales bacterium]